MAIKRSLLYIKNLLLNNKKLLICSDSKAALSAIRGTNCKKRYKLLTEIRELIHDITTASNSISFYWIPSHIGITSNEKVDNYAKKAANNYDITPITSLPLDYHEYFPLIDKFLTEEFYNNLVATNSKYSQNCLISSSKANLHSFCSNFSIKPSRLCYSTMAKLRLNALRPKYSKTAACKCGSHISIQHIILLNCPIFTIEISNSSIRSFFFPQKPTSKEILTDMYILKQFTDLLTRSPLKNVL